MQPNITYRLSVNLFLLLYYWSSLSQQQVGMLLTSGSVIALPSSYVAIAIARHKILAILHTHAIATYTYVANGRTGMHLLKDYSPLH